MSKFKMNLVIFMAILLIAGVLPAFANQIEQKRGELQSVQEDLSERKKELQQNKQEQNKTLREIRFLDSEISVIQAELRTLTAKIKTKEAEIVQTEQEVEQAEKRIAIMDEILAVRLRAISEKGKISFLDVLLNSASFGEFLTRYNDLQIILAEDRLLLEEYQAERTRFLAAAAALEEHRQSLEQVRRQTLHEENRLKDRQSRQRQLSAMLRQAIDDTEREIEKLEEEAKALTRTIAQLQARRSPSEFLGSGEMRWPVPEFGPGWITSGFGFRRNPFTGRPGSFHGGIDIGIPHNRWERSASFNGDPVFIVAAETGIAYTFRMGSGYGNLVVIDHGGGIVTVYGHANRFIVQNGQTVAKGDRIATVGSTGYSTGPHLHFEVRVNGSRVNPMQYLQ